MKKVFFLFSFLGISFFAQAQIGINGAYRFNDAENWKLVNALSGMEKAKLLGNGYSLGIDYWFRLKNSRVEFLPEINFSISDQELDNEVKLQTKFYSLFFNTNIYFLDFSGDCDCPTFSKDGNSLEKGLFLQISPGISYLQENMNSPENKANANDFAFSIAAALGFDLGLSDLITLTPIAGVRYYPSATWEGLATANRGIKELEIGGETSSIVQVFSGIRLGFRFDQ